MRLPEYAVRNHQFTVIIVILLTLVGIVSFFTMPRSEDPQISPAGSSIIVVYPGANPVDLEELVVDPIEEALNELEDIKDIRTGAEDGLVVINIEFLSGSNPDDKYSDVLEKINSVRNKLPSDIVRLEVQKWSINEVKILQLAIISETASYKNLEKEADRLKKNLERVSGVKKIETMAFPEQQVKISLDFEKIAKLNIPLSRVVGIIQGNNVNIPGGNLDIGNKRFNLQTSGSYDSIDEIKNTIIDASGGRVLYLKDIANVELGYEDKSYYARVNKQRAVFLTATQKEGTNIYDIMKGINEKVSDFQHQLPGSMKIEHVFDQSESVSHRLTGFFVNLLQGLFLVGLVVLIALGFRASIIVIMVIPISILLGIGALDVTQFGIQQMSIAGLVIALGLLVDNAIVVTENITRFMKKGYSPLDAAAQGTDQIGWAIVSSTATTVLAFVPIILMKNITGEFIRSMPATVVYTLTASLLISLTLTPYLSSKFIRITGKYKESRFKKLLDKLIETKYRKSLDFALRKPTLVIVLSIVFFFGSLALFPIVGVSFFPKAEKPQFLINIKTPEGTSLDKTDKVVRYVESVLNKRDEIKVFAANIGHGNPRIYYNTGTQQEKSSYAQIYVELKERDLETFNSLVSGLRSEFTEYPGAKIDLKEFEQGPPVAAPIEIRLLGENLDELKKISADVENMFQSTPGTVNIVNPLGTSKADLQIKINIAKAGMMGVQLVEIDKTVRAAISGLPVSRYRDSEGKEYNITVRLPISNTPDFSDLDKIYVTSVAGAQIPLKQLASIEFKGSPLKINHYNLQRNATLTADVLSGNSVDKVTNEIIKKLDAYNWPAGYNYYVAGELESREESFGGMLQAVIIAILGIFGVLVLQFRSYIQPLIVFSAIPLAIIGSIFTLLITGNSFSFTAFVGLASLVGIVVNNSIILVDYTNQLRKTGSDIISALKEAGETRFVPILLTTATTVGGLLPLTLGGGTMWAPMGWTIIGGLVLSTFLTLIVVPVLYKIYTK